MKIEFNRRFRLSIQFSFQLAGTNQRAWRWVWKLKFELKLEVFDWTLKKGSSIELKVEIFNWNLKIKISIEVNFQVRHYYNNAEIFLNIEVFIESLMSSFIDKNIHQQSLHHSNIEITQFHWLSKQSSETFLSSFDSFKAKFLCLIFTLHIPQIFLIFLFCFLSFWIVREIFFSMKFSRSFFISQWKRKQIRQKKREKSLYSLVDLSNGWRKAKRKVYLQDHSRIKTKVNDDLEKEKKNDLGEKFV